MGNHEGAGATIEMSVRAGTERHPGNNEVEARKVQQLGEFEYMRQVKLETFAWIRTHPAAFIRLTALRVAQFWFGPVDDRRVGLRVSLMTMLSVLGAWRALPLLSVPQRAALLIPFAVYPLVYYVVGFEVRYREPLDGLTLLLAATALSARFRPRTNIGAPSSPCAHNQPEVQSWSEVGAPQGGETTYPVALPA
jgi:hypothetical protein